MGGLAASGARRAVGRSDGAAAVAREAKRVGSELEAAQDEAQRAKESEKKLAAEVQHRQGGEGKGADVCVSTRACVSWARKGWPLCASWSPGVVCGRTAQR